jgi:hypothetical protein
VPFPNDDAVSSLSDILETGDVPQRYFLSPKACSGILRRAEKRGKELPAQSILTGAAAIAFIAVLATGKAWTHQAPTGWSYPANCCSGVDCREVPDADIIEGARGYEIRKTHELIPMTDPKVKMSPDSRFHWCSVGGLDDSRTICLFVPGRGS